MQLPVVENMRGKGWISTKLKTACFLTSNLLVHSLLFIIAQQLLFFKLRIDDYVKSDAIIRVRTTKLLIDFRSINKYTRTRDDK